jgi:phosphatidylserine synthase
MRQYVIQSNFIHNMPFTRTENEHATMRILLPVVVAIIAIIVSFYNKEVALAFFTLAILFNLSRRSTRYLFKIIDLFRPTNKNTPAN